MNRLRCALVAGLIFCAVLTVGGLLVWLTEQHHQQERETLALRSAERHADDLHHQLDKSLSTTYALASVIRQRGMVENFDGLASEMVKTYGAISSLAIAPGAVVTAIYPRPENDPALGHDLLADPKRRADALRAINSRKLTLSGPLDLIQGGKAVIGRLPIFLPDAEATEYFWGFTIVVLRVEDLAKAAQLEQLHTQDGYDYRVLRLDPVTRAPRLVTASVPHPLDKPVRLRVDATDGDWIMELAPRAGWGGELWLAGEIVLLLLVAGSLGVLSYGLLRQPELLRRQVALRTETLANTNRLLAAEVGERQRAVEALRRSEDRFRTLVENSNDWIWEVDGNFVYTYSSPRVTAILGYDPTEIVGRKPFDFMAPNEALRVDALTEPLAAERSPLALLEITHRHRDGRDVVVEVSALPIVDPAGRFHGYRGIGRDVTERKHAMERIRRLARTHAVLSQVNHAMVRTTERELLFAEVCRVAVQAGAFRMASVCLLEEGGTRVAAAEGDAVYLSYLDRLGEYIDEGNGGPITHAMRADTPCIANRLAAAPSAARWHRAALEHGFGAMAAFPLRLDGRPIGSFALGSAETDFFDEQETALLEELAEDISFALQTMAQESRRRQAEDDLRLSARVFENSAEGIIITDAQNRILKVNKAFCAVTGYAAEEVQGKNPKILASGLQDAEFYRRMWESLSSCGQWQGEIWNRRKSGDFYPEWLNISAVKNGTGELTNYVAVFTDITSRKEIEQHLNYLAYYDVLTGLPNRTLFYDRLRQAAAQANRNRQSVAVMFVDLDRFKVINDTLGHAIGDLLLKEVAARISACVRHGDTVSRLGGDEFTVILTHLACVDDAAVVANKIIDALSQPFQLEEHEVFVSGSIGISVFPMDGENLEALVKNADTAMYRAKEVGRNNYQFYRAEMNERALERLEMETSLRHALDRGEFELYYQPKIDLGSGAVVGAEALLRWHRPGHGVVSPAEFIELLEETGLILPVGEWVLRQACAQNRRWADAGHRLVMAVNFSTRQFRQHDVVAALHCVVKDTGIDPHCLEIELTESILMQYAEETIRTLSELKALGLRLAIDDFGTGYSSLAYLKRFPIDILKIDRSFVRDIPGDPDDAAIAAAIIAMGHQLKLRIIAEGVETPEQLAFLSERGCDEIQGYLAGQPVPAAKFEQLLTERTKATAV